MSMKQNELTDNNNCGEDMRTLGRRFYSTGMPRVSRVSRIMGPLDSNMAGNVHGGVLTKTMTDDTMMVAAMRHLNQFKAVEMDAALATLGTTHFLAPVHIGELIEATATVLFTTDRSLYVTCELYAENLQTGFRRLTNRCSAWYVGVEGSSEDGTKLIVPKKIPQLEANPTQMEENQRIYKEEVRRRQNSENSESFLLDRFDKQEWTGIFSHLVGPTDLYHKHAPGGLLIKIMDEAGFLAATKHSRNLCVTASFETLRFRHPLLQGDLVTVKSRPTYASSKSLEVEIIAQKENLLTGEKLIAAHGHFVFVALDANGKAVSIPPLENFEPEAEQRYLERRERQKQGRK